MRPDRIAQLRQETVDMFYHGYDNYMKIAFPEDELRPLSCTPLSRDALNPRNVELNDVLGNYSLTLIDSLSTLAILASAPPDGRHTAEKALSDFQDGVKALVDQYGDGRPGPSGQGLRARGFDLDSKVQVFETVIRGLGGLLSAHLFAVGELPISGYNPPKSSDPLNLRPIAWPNGLKYDGQLLRLALDLGQRLLPAFYTATGMPYPRVNLRHGIPFYTNSPLHEMSTSHRTGSDGPAEITETCSAGAGSLVLEFTALSRLTGDTRFEQLAKRAFWAVWYRRSDIGLIGAGVDAEHGKWIGAYAVIGAGADSFFEYALKTHILLSGHELPNRTASKADSRAHWLDPNTIYPPLSEEENSPDSFLEAWHHAHAAIKRHLYSDREHPHYVNVNLWTGSLASNWIDSLGAYYSGLLVLGGELDEAIETNLLYTALWTKYAALPERWSVREKTVEGGLGWWPLRPEFIESVYHLYRATKDPWYLYVGEMVQQDIKRRCWTECGWAGLQNVVDGEKSDRMESFFLGETAKYMYLLFDERHPLNSLDAPYVFTTEGHPLIIPKKGVIKKKRSETRPAPPATSKDLAIYHDEGFTYTCPIQPELPALTGSAVAARDDIYHAARMLDLHLVPNYHAGIEAGDKPGQHEAITNYTYFPWTLPPSLLPDNGTCAKVSSPLELTLEFASNAQQGGVGSAFNFLLASQNLERLNAEKIRVLTLSGLKLTMRLVDGPEQEWRVTKVNGLPLGRDENVVFDRSVLRDVSDPRFNVVRDPVIAKLHHLHHVDLTQRNGTAYSTTYNDDQPEETTYMLDLDNVPQNRDPSDASTDIGSFLRSWFSQMVGSLESHTPFATTTLDSVPDGVPFNLLMNATAVTPTGPGAAPLPGTNIPAGAHIPAFGPVSPQLLPWDTVFAAGNACSGPLPDDAPARNQVIVIRRGGCSFSAKLANIPAHTPSPQSLQLVVVVSDDDDESELLPRGGRLLRDIDGAFIRPLLDQVQLTPSGIPRRNPIAMVMIGGGDAAYAQLTHADALGITRRYYVESQGVRVRNIIVDDGDARTLPKL
ncbi:alpha-1,2-Mannosidase [Pleurostoma richardsiae]|uniref:alpha-1,2-Mannosidase n=1 Tax=Pleurostoma richardsiae TaxID=41990 RepID=A0AA38RWN8_9PEZI|nr:alpha-1,2-Mannosidase [Pleurostoma richardsiae]